MGWRGWDSGGKYEGVSLTLTLMPSQHLHSPHLWPGLCSATRTCKIVLSFLKDLVTQMDQGPTILLPK